MYFVNNGETDDLYYPENPFTAPDGYAFSGWLSSEDPTLRQPGRAYPAVSQTVTAQWEKLCTVRTDSGDSVLWVAPATAVEGEQVAVSVLLDADAYADGTRLKKLIVTDSDGHVNEIAEDAAGAVLCISTNRAENGLRHDEVRIDNTTLKAFSLTAERFQTPIYFVIIVPELLRYGYINRRLSRKSVEGKQ